MKVATLLGSLSRNNGGVSEVARRLSQELVAQPGCSIEVFGIRDAFFEEDRPGWPPLEPQAFNPVPPRSFGYAPRLAQRLSASAPDLIHVHGLWGYAGIAARRSGRRYCISPHGMLDRWALDNSSWKKRIAGALFERRNLQDAACLHAITPQERDAIRAYGIETPVCVIPNGVDLPPDEATPRPAPWASVARGKKVLLYLGRLHPKKGLLPLIDGWHRACRDSSTLRSDWILAIAGWDQGDFTTVLQSRVQELQLQDHVTFVGSQFGPDKAASYRAATAFILPSFSEGLPLVVLEAWAYGLPVLMTPECNLPIGFTRRAALTLSPEAEPISRTLTEFASLPDSEHREIGARGRELVAAEFSWKSAAAEMHRVYQWLVNDGPKPNSLLP